MDYFIRFEYRENGIKFVCNRLNIPFEPENIPRLKVMARDKSIPIWMSLHKGIEENS